jgi:hypothetical protein
MLNFNFKPELSEPNESRYSSSSTKMMRILAAPALQRCYNG